jgi:deoxyribodipyrimidine photo-lyase
MTGLIWFRNDLRLHDHHPLGQALQHQGQIVPLYCVDPRQFSQTHFGFAKTGAHRAKFLLQSLADLRRSLRRLGSDLVIRRGQPEAVIPALARELGIDTVYWHGEVTAEELAVEQALKDRLAQGGIQPRVYWGATLYHPDQLPFGIAQLPQVFTQFRKTVEGHSTVAAPLPTPDQLPALPPVEVGEIPPLAALGLTEPDPDPRAVLPFEGGETAGLQRLQHYLWDTDCLKNYKQTRNGMVGADYSSKLSPWLALGCLSPRRVYETVQAYEQTGQERFHLLAGV